MNLDIKNFKKKKKKLSGLAILSIEKKNVKKNWL